MERPQKTSAQSDVSGTCDSRSVLSVPVRRGDGSWGALKPWDLGIPPAKNWRSGVLAMELAMSKTGRPPKSQAEFDGKWW